MIQLVCMISIPHWLYQIWKICEHEDCHPFLWAATKWNVVFYIFKNLIPYQIVNVVGENGKSMSLRRSELGERDRVWIIQIDLHILISQQLNRCIWTREIHLTNFIRLLIPSLKFLCLPSTSCVVVSHQRMPRAISFSLSILIMCTISIQLPCRSFVCLPYVSM